jgi:hypothetical protein
VGETAIRLVFLFKSIVIIMGYIMSNAYPIVFGRLSPYLRKIVPLSSEDCPPIFGGLSPYLRRIVPHTNCNTLKLLKIYTGEKRKKEKRKRERRARVIRGIEKFSCRDTIPPCRFAAPRHPSQLMCRFAPSCPLRSAMCCDLMDRLRALRTRYARSHGFVAL